MLPIVIRLGLWVDNVTTKGWTIDRSALYAIWRQSGVHSNLQSTTYCLMTRVWNTGSTGLATGSGRPPGQDFAAAFSPDGDQQQDPGRQLYTDEKGSADYAQEAARDTASMMLMAPKPS